MQRKRIPRLNEYQSRRGTRRSDAPPEPPCPPEAGDVSADLACGRSPPWTPGAGGAYTRHSSCAALAHGWSPPPTGAQGRMRSSGAGMFFFAFQGI